LILDGLTASSDDDGIVVAMMAILRFGGARSGPGTVVIGERGARECG
jgi:hypothetical protein